jgi:hypothetical protein
VIATDVSDRALAILERFPRHLELARRDKLAAEVVQALVSGLDAQTAQIGRIRRAHRLGHADELRDLMLLGALHGIRAAELAALPRRLRALDAAAAALAAAGPAVATARGALAPLVGEGQATFVAWPGEPDDSAAIDRLLAALAAATAYEVECGLVRRRIATSIAIHRAGNGTIDALLRGAANALDLDVLRVRHTGDGFWHLADCADRLQLRRPEPPGGERTVAVPPPIDTIALEENPRASRDIEPFAVQHARLLTIARPGFATVPVTIRVRGVAKRTMHPMVVNRDTGVGVAYRGEVPDGGELVLDRAGGARLAGADVASFTWAFRGAVFANGGEDHRLDFCFTDGAGATPRGQAAAFVIGDPFADALSPAASWPHAAGAPPVHLLAVGPTRWAFFVREAHAGTTDAAGTAPVAATPYPFAGVFDGSVLAGSPRPDAAKIGFGWEEREPFAARLFVPERFAVLDGDTDPDPDLTELVRVAVERFRAAGIRLTVHYTSQLWTLGQGVLRDPDSSEPEGLVVDGARLWPTPPQT